MVKVNNEQINDMTIHYDIVVKIILNIEIIIPMKPLWSSTLYLTHQEKNKLMCTQHRFRQFGKLLPDEMEHLNQWNECATKVKWKKL